MHSLFVLLKSNSGQLFYVTIVYGPTDDNLKQQFISDLRNIAGLVDHPWILAGDFNLVRWLTDRSGNQRNFNLMQLFNDFISDAGLVDTLLKNRKFTWTSKRPDPVFSKIDRVLTSAEWTLVYPVITLEALEILISDHTPLLLTCKGL